MPINNKVLDYPDCVIVDVPDVSITIFGPCTYSLEFKLMNIAIQALIILIFMRIAILALKPLAIKTPLPLNRMLRTLHNSGDDEGLPLFIY